VDVQTGNKSKKKEGKKQFAIFQNQINYVFEVVVPFLSPTFPYLLPFLIYAASKLAM
jgi:hypothetical protein